MAAGSLTLGPATAAPARDLTASPVEAAVRATTLAQRVHFSVAVTVSDVSLRASGAVDLRDDRTVLDVSAGGSSTEFRRIGRNYYVNAQRLGSASQRWVVLDSVAEGMQMSTRSVSGLVTSLSPQRTLHALESASSIAQVGTDTFGIHYRVRVSDTRPNFVPMITTFATTPIREGSDSTIDVWVNAQGLVSRLTYATSSVTSTFTLHSYGDAIGAITPPASATGDLSSTSGRFLFGAGLRYSNPSSPSPRVTLAPTVDFVEGIVQGNLHAASRRDQDLRFEFLSSSKGGKLSLGTVPDNEPSGGPQSFTVLPYATWLTGQRAKGLETFTVRAREVTRIDDYVKGIPLIGDIAAPVIDLLQNMPIVNEQLAPVIGASATTRVNVSVDQLAPGDTPIAYTTRVRGYRGAMISTNFFPATGLSAGDVAPVILDAPGLGEPGATDPYSLDGSRSMVPGVLDLRTAGYNVITWDPRGSFDSDGILQLNNPFFDSVDVSALVTWASENTAVQLNGAGDPATGMIGGSSGGAIQLMTASIDPRIDAIVPTVTWNSLIDSLQPHGVLNTTATSQLLAALTGPKIRLNGQIRNGLANAIATGRLSTSTLTVLADKNVGALLGQIQAPTLLMQGTVDAVFPLHQSLSTAQRILSNPFGTPVKVAWFDSTRDDATRDEGLQAYTILWLNKYVSGSPIPDVAIPTFQWWDRFGFMHPFDYFPFQAGFDVAPPLSATSSGGRITISPDGAAVPLSRIVARVPVPAGTRVIGTPTLRFTYQGTGSARAIFVRISDERTHESIGQAASPVPVVLDGRTHTITIPLGDIAYTNQVRSGLDFTIAGTARDFVNSSSGRLTLRNITITVPQHPAPVPEQDG